MCARPKIEHLRRSSSHTRYRPEGEHGRDLVDRAKQGDKDAFTALVLRYGDRLYSVAFQILRDTTRAEDAVQQTYLTAWRELRRLRDDDRLEAWLYRLLVNACYAELRHTRRWQPGLRVVADPEIGPSTNDAQGDVALRDELERAFRRLSGEQRAVLRDGHHFLGLSGEEIAGDPRTLRRHRLDRDFITQDNRCGRPSRPSRRHLAAAENWHDPGFERGPGPR